MGRKKGSEGAEGSKGSEGVVSPWRAMIINAAAGGIPLCYLYQIFSIGSAMK